MNYFSTGKLFGPKTREENRCSYCSAQLKLVSKMMDPRRGRMVRIFECGCGQQSWADDPLD
jgi:uncharacterized protein with PIN domain